MGYFIYLFIYYYYYNIITYKILNITVIFM